MIRIKKVFDIIIRAIIIILFIKSMNKYQWITLYTRR